MRGSSLPMSLTPAPIPIPPRSGRDVTQNLRESSDLVLAPESMLGRSAAFPEALSC